MSSTNSDSIDFDNLELKIYEKLVQLQLKDEALERTQAQLMESQNLVCELKVRLENERQALDHAKLEIKSTVNLMTRLEKEKVQSQSECARLRMTWENSLLTSDHLINQARICKLESIQLQRKNEALEANLAEQKMLNKLMEDSLQALRNQMTKFIPLLQSNITCLKDEQECLRNSFRSVAEFRQQILVKKQENIAPKCQCQKIVLQEVQNKNQAAKKRTIMNTQFNQQMALKKEDCNTLNEEFNAINKELMHLESVVSWTNLKSSTNSG